MSAKFGQCRLCPKASPAKRLYGDDLCSYHLGNTQDDQSKVKLEKEISDLVLTPYQKKLLKKFYMEQAEQVPEFCENKCGKKLFAQDTWRIKALICHIVPKRHFHSVMVHPANRWFGCHDCHHDYDDKGWSHAVTMPVWQVCAERFQEFMHFIKESELQYLPDAFRILLTRPS
jgi:hypothetical protein